MYTSKALDSGQFGNSLWTPPKCPILGHSAIAMDKRGYETPLWTCARVAHLIEDEFGVAHHPGHVWKILFDLGWSCQRPVGRARERNEEQIRRWRRVRWPAIKKKLSRKGVRSSSSTKAG